MIDRRYASETKCIRYEWLHISKYMSFQNVKIDLFSERPLDIGKGLRFINAMRSSYLLILQLVKVGVQ